MTTRTGHRAATLPAALAALALTVLLTGCGSEDDAREAGATSTATDPASDPAASSTAPTPAPTSEPAPATSPTAPVVPAGTPECAEVWVADATLPRGYRGCVEDGALVRADRLGCESGQAIVRYADRFYAVAGGVVNEATPPLLDDPDYTASVARCRA